MPRFSDIFSWSRSEYNKDSYAFYDCFLLKDVQCHKVYKRFDKIIFDIPGMILFLFESNGNVNGPYCLTI